jgi:tetratricopeptide (TPR) repeat protein
MSSSEDMAEAFWHHERGSLDEASRLYRRALATRPDDPDALHLLGLALLQQGDAPGAAAHIVRASTLAPGRAEFHSNLAEAYRALGQVDRAADAARVALRLWPDYPEALNNLAQALLENGEVDAAAGHFREALRLRPGFALAWNNLGNALRLKGDTSGSLEHFRRAAELDSSLPEAQSNLAQALFEANRLDEALAHGREAVRLRPAFPEALSNLGNFLFAIGRLDEALVYYDEALGLAPNFAVVHENRGQALLEQGRLAEAVASYRRALELDPLLTRARSHLAGALAEQGDDAGAVATYLEALRDDANLAEAHSGLGRVYAEQGRYAEAEDCYRAALGLAPGLPSAHCRLGHLRSELGDFHGAEQCFREALRHDPDLADALAGLATLLRGKLPAADLDALRARLTALGDGSEVDGNGASLHFALAHVLDGRGDYAEAAAYLDRANALALGASARRGRTYDPAGHSRFVDRLVASFSPVFFDRVRGLGSDSERPVFIVGLPRSGTTLTEQILAGHPRAFGAGERRFAREVFETLCGTGDDPPRLGLAAHLDAPTTRALADWYLAQLHALDAGAAARVVDKMPENYLYLGLLAALFPGARFVHCRRDLRDTAVSCWMTDFRQVRWANDPDHIAGRFADYGRVMAHWRRVFPVPVLEVTYEETVADLECSARRLVAWCGLDWDPACLAFHQVKRPVRTASVTQVRQPIYTRSVARWKNYESALGPLLVRLEGQSPPKSGYPKGAPQPQDQG